MQKERIMNHPLALSFIKAFLLALSALFISIILLFGIDTSLTPYNYSILLGVNIYMVLCARRNLLLFIISFVILYFNYSIVYANFSGNIDDDFASYITLKVSVISINILTLFNCLLLFFVRWEKAKPISNWNIFISKENKNDAIVALLIVLLLFIFVFGFNRPALGERGMPSPIYEYSVILFALYFYYSGGKELYLNIGKALAVLFALQSMVFGGRVDAIQFLLCMFIMNYMHKISMHTVIFLMLISFFILSLIGAVRSNLVSGNFDVLNIFISIIKNGFASDTAYFAYYCTETFVYVKDILPPVQVNALFGDYLKSIILGGAAGESSHLPNVTIDYVFHYYGGMFPFYFYFYLGIFGVFISSFIVSIFLNLVVGIEKSSTYIKLLSLWVVCCVFRWYAYSTMPLTRGFLLFTLAYFGFKFIDRVSHSIKYPPKYHPVLK